MRFPRPAVLAASTAAAAVVLTMTGAVAAHAADSTPTPSSTAPMSTLTKAHDGTHDGPLAQLVAAGTITKAQADAVKAALKAQRSTDHSAHDAAKASALASLVSKGTITQAQADAITAAGREGVRDLITKGTITKEQAKAVGDAMRALRPAQPTPGAAGARLTSVLADLVSKGTITQAQADAIAAAKPAHLKGGPGTHESRHQSQNQRSTRIKGGTSGTPSRACPSSTPSPALTVN